MSEKTFETRSYVFGRDVANMSDDELISAIGRVEKEIVALSEVSTKSEKIKARITQLTADADTIASLLDARA